ELENGKTLDVDMVIPATGSRSNNKLLNALDDVQFDSMGRAETDGLMRPSPSRPNLFCIGDVASLGEGMTIVAISRQVPWLSKTLKAYSKGAAIDTAPRYKPWPVAPIILPLGAEKGASILPFGPKGVSVGDFLTRKIKGEHLFLPKYRKLLNA
ncbi:MAG: NAD(P)/FAD-dependent oxidoreductase, partial [Sneathiellales bacterium]|nr:NAD(P)/FAD-dependent oxidoreductase [Sneathiellales bacterium]